MLKNTLAALVTLLILSSAAFASGSGSSSKGCKPENVTGTYTLTDPETDVFSNGTNVAHTFIFQLTLHSDGTVNQYWTGLPDYFIELGTGSPWIGSWKCRDDGKLLVTTLRAIYQSLPAPGSPACLPAGSPPCFPTADIELQLHIRTTYLFNVDNNTLKRIQLRSRFYGVTEDPADPNAGSLGTLSTTQVVYKRFKASDADLLLP